MIGHATTGQLIMIPLATAALAALGVAWAVDRVRDRRWQHWWDQALADAAWRSSVRSPEPFAVTQDKRRLTQYLRRLRRKKN